MTKRLSRDSKGKKGYFQEIPLTHWKFYCYLGGHLSNPVHGIATFLCIIGHKITTVINLNSW
jgi:hypothetical protein